VAPHYAPARRKKGRKAGRSLRYSLKCLSVSHFGFFFLDTTHDSTCWTHARAARRVSDVSLERRGAGRSLHRASLTDSSLVSPTRPMTQRDILDQPHPALVVALLNIFDRDGSKQLSKEEFDVCASTLGYGTSPSTWAAVCRRFTGFPGAVEELDLSVAIFFLFM
jgi:hypothetical protein